jgi:hypothetical protein
VSTEAAACRVQAPASAAGRETVLPAEDEELVPA